MDTTPEYSRALLDYVTHYARSPRSNPDNIAALAARGDWEFVPMPRSLVDQLRGGARGWPGGGFGGPMELMMGSSFFDPFANYYGRPSDMVRPEFQPGNIDPVPWPNGGWGGPGGGWGGPGGGWGGPGGGFGGPMNLMMGSSFFDPFMNYGRPPDMVRPEFQPGYTNPVPWGGGWGRAGGGWGGPGGGFGGPMELMMGNSFFDPFMNYGRPPDMVRPEFQPGWTTPAPWGGGWGGPGGGFGGPMELMMGSSYFSPFETYGRPPDMVRPEASSRLGRIDIARGLAAVEPLTELFGKFQHAVENGDLDKAMDCVSADFLDSDGRDAGSFRTDLKAAIGDTSRRRWIVLNADNLEVAGSRVAATTSVAYEVVLADEASTRLSGIERLEVVFEESAADGQWQITSLRPAD